MSDVISLPIERIHVGKRLRAVDPAAVALIAASMVESGQHTPIHVGPANADGIHPLIAGAHRVAAAREAGLPTLAAIVFRGDALQAELLEIDENLLRRGLSELDRAVFLARRKELYEALNPLTKQGKARAGETERQNVVLFRAPAFTEDVAQRVGLSRRQIERSVARARIEPELRERLALTRWADHGATLDALAKAAPGVRAKLVAALTREDRPARNIAAAWEEVQPSRGTLDSVDDVQLHRLREAWRKSGAKAREMFLRHLAQEPASRARLLVLLDADEAAEERQARVVAAVGAAGRAA